VICFHGLFGDGVSVSVPVCAGVLDYFRPLLGPRIDECAELVRRRAQRCSVELGKPHLDEKLYAIKGIEIISIATPSSRVSVPFRVEDYGRGWFDRARPGRPEEGADSALSVTR
jgi:hypothetical protein